MFSDILLYFKDLNTQDTRRPGVYNMLYNNTQCDRLTFKLVFVQLGGNMVVHGKYMIAAFLFSHIGL